MPRKIVRVGKRRFYEEDVRRHMTWAAGAVIGLPGALVTAHLQYRFEAWVLFSVYLASTLMFMIDVAATEDAPDDR